MRLASLRRWLRFVVAARGLSWLLALALGAAVLVGWLDWRIHLPSLVRAIVLTGTLGAMAYVALRFLLRPLKTSADDLSLALRIEDLNPSLKDSLASTVEFLEQSADAPQLDSARLRQETVQRTLRQVEDLDFYGVVSTRGVPSAGLSLVAAGVLAFLLMFLYPAQAGTALARLANPFGSRDWPKKTRLDIRAPARVARGEPFEIQGSAHGVIPPQAVVEYEGGLTAKQACPILPGKEPHSGTWMARRDRVERSFRFQVQANDAVSDWQEVAVLPPPVLAPLDGRVSPLVHLDYPAYTDLPPHDLPDGSGNIEAVAGTVATWRAATDRPVAKAWIEYRPEHPHVGPASFLAVLGASHPASFLCLTASGQAIWDRLPLQVDSTGRVLSLEFVPRVSGLYALRLEDDSGLGTARLFDLRIFRDPEPTVTLERPSSTHDSLDVLPGAEITLQAIVEDPQFAVRSVVLEYRCRKNDPPRRLPLYDHAAVGTALPPLLCSLAGQPLPVPALRLRPQRLRVTRRFELDQFKHLDGSGLKEGDVLTLLVAADDFDDVSVGKKPGRSHEMELRLVDRSALEMLMSKAQGQVQQDLVRLRQMQREALQKVIGPEQQWRNTGKLREQDLDQLFQAEQIQQQIRARVGSEREGLRAEVARILQTLKDNHLPRSGTNERMETVAAELERIAQENLEQIEPNLARARKEEAAGQGKKPADGQTGPLREARRHQEEVENTLGELLKLLEPWGSINEIKGDAKSILQDQRKLFQETRSLDKDGTRGKKPEELTPEQKALLDKAAQWQSKLAERAADLLGKMDRIGADRREKDGPLAEALKAAADQGRKDGLGEQMKEAGAKIGKNQLGDAGQAQQQALDILGKMVQALEERREEELDRLRKQLKEAQEKLADLIQRQEQLRKKIKQAEQLADLAQRREELKRLSREQEKLQKEAQEMLRELTRLRMDRAKQALGEAGERMAELSRRLDQNEPTEDTQEETLDRLNEARRELQREQKEVEEELAREKLAKVADEIKRLQERQNAALAEGARIDRAVLQRKGWDRGLLRSLNDLSSTQKELSEETESVARGKLAGAPVFARILTRSAEAMQRAAEHVRNHFEQARDNPESIDPDPEAPKQQAEAARRLQQLLDALQPEKGLGLRGPPPSGDDQPGRGARRRPGDESLSVLAQLKGVRLLQQELNEKTEAFARRYPDPAKLPPPALRELDGLHQEQRELVELFEELTKPGDTDGGDK
jgi:hypothetical protein